jgi:hypothetical protein
VHRLRDIVARYWEDYKSSPDRKLSLKSLHHLAIHCINACRTAVMGGVALVCEDCGEVHYHFHSCGHRFCPTCGVLATNKWAKQVLSQLPNIKHYHIVFTLPYKLRYLSQQNGDILHNLIFRIAYKVLEEWFAARGLKCGVIAVLHTAGSDLKYHPHGHFIVSAGGQDLETKQIIELEGDYLTSHKYLANKFRFYFNQALIGMYDKGELKVKGEYEHRPYFLNFIKSLNEKAWIVGIEKPLKDATDIVRYVARYTRRACISEYRIQSIDNGKISFSFNDYKNTPKGQYPPVQGQCTLTYVQFFDRLLQHVPTPGFQAVRRYGLYTGQNLKTIPPAYKIPENAIQTLDTQEDEDLIDDPSEWTLDYDICPHCQTKRIVLEVFTPKRLVNKVDNWIVVNKTKQYENSS